MDLINCYWPICLVKHKAIQQITAETEVKGKGVSLLGPEKIHSIDFNVEGAGVTVQLSTLATAKEKGISQVPLQ